MDYLKIAQQYVAVKTLMKGSKNFDDIRSQSQFNNLIAFQKENLLKELAQAQIETQKKREILKECMRKTQALEKMKEIKFNEYKEEIKKTENKRIEEISSIKINSQNI